MTLIIVFMPVYIVGNDGENQKQDRDDPPLAATGAASCERRAPTVRAPNKRRHDLTTLQKQRSVRMARQIVKEQDSFASSEPKWSVYYCRKNIRVIESKSPN